MTRNIKLLIQYDGKDFSGWQKQNNAITVQSELEKKLSVIVNEPINLIGSGRTDSGVHALGQVANFQTSSKIALSSLIMAINSYLQKSIRVMDCEDVPLDFHARFSAIRREYKYVIYNDRFCPPFVRNYVHHIFKPVDVDKLRATLKLLEGEHDFTSFCSVNDDSKVKIRLMHNIDVESHDKEIIIWLRANAFLRKMVRMIIGTALDINLKNFDADEMSKVLAMKNHKNTFFTAPASGLYLSRVWY